MVEIPRKILLKLPKYCKECGCVAIDYMHCDENKYTFQCKDCGIYYYIPVDSDQKQLFPELQWKR